MNKVRRREVTGSCPRSHSRETQNPVLEPPSLWLQHYSQCWKRIAPPARLQRKRYANEVGEAFRSLVPAAVVWLSYGVSSSYVLADAIDKGKKARDAPSPEAGRSTRVTVAVVDTFVWQALASVAIPGFTINRVCAASLYILGTTTRWPLAVRKWTTTALGLLAIPIIIHPIDRSVDFLLDSSLRKLYPSVEKPSSS
ncbi:mitochondrial fission process protein 1 isoform X1 [Hippopotamus amphibius kiboko]|uniref:mitochondrial fission process protein 1 isoform X1 n=1 Tax=Hippopotamus amphibius kiboko TaxID=575201 RepID=UPI002592B103|nr:mitochondrial fission process protein 1 isoform X1 [Hippopotamus amphibius kiboko]